VYDYFLRQGGIHALPSMSNHNYYAHTPNTKGIHTTTFNMHNTTIQRRNMGKLDLKIDVKAPAD
jgi:hypothetical protein